MTVSGGAKSSSPYKISLLQNVTKCFALGRVVSINDLS
jgi:hypothetical protein